MSGGETISKNLTKNMVPPVTTKTVTAPMFLRIWDVLMKFSRRKFHKTFSHEPTESDCSLVSDSNSPAGSQLERHCRLTAVRQRIDDFFKPSRSSLGVSTQKERHTPRKSSQNRSESKKSPICPPFPG